MNPDSATMRSTDLCALLGASDQSLYRWLGRPYPPHHFSRVAPRGKTYALPEAVARLRERRARGLSGDDLARVVEFDTVSRSAMESDFLWVGEYAQRRAAAFFTCLEGKEPERARDCMKAVRNAAIACGLPVISPLGQIALLHPGIVRFVLTDDPAELPVGDAGWVSFAKALWAVNPDHESEAA